MLTLILALVLDAVAAASPAVQTSSTRLSVATAADDHVILNLSLDDGRSSRAAGAVLVRVDGRDAQHIILTPGVGRSKYDALLGPLEAGTHEIQLAASPYWLADPGVAIRDASTRIVRADDPSAALLQHAPTLGIRADTVGTASDLPLMMYVEDERKSGDGWVRYSVIFSNEDGGTSTPALLARWGRTTDIELIYELEWRGGRVVQERIQAPDHRILPFNGVREGRHPYLLVATLNNMVIDRGLSVAAVRPVPVVVNLAAATRESVMDSEPWSYRVMARELTAEGRIGAEVKDPREYLYVEAKLELENAAVSVLAGAGELMSDSSTGNQQWAVDRNGWVRIAVRTPVAPTALQWRCVPRRKNPTDAVHCTIEMTRAFRLDQTYVPGASLTQGRQIRMTDGLSDLLPLRTPESRER